MRASGKKKRLLRKRASKARVSMLSRRNSGHTTPSKGKWNKSALLKRAPEGYRTWLSRVAGNKVGKRALRRYKSFTGIPLPTQIHRWDDGRKRTRFLVGMGHSPWAFVANGPKGKATKVKKYRGHFTPAFSADGKQIVILSGRLKGFGKGLKFVGWVPETHYRMTADMEQAGSHKKGVHWIHKHDDEGGRWPRVYRDKAGNFFYGRSTYRVGAWIRK